MDSGHRGHRKSGGSGLEAATDVSSWPARTLKFDADPFPTAEEAKDDGANVVEGFAPLDAPGIDCVCAELDGIELLEETSGVANSEPCVERGIDEAAACNAMPSSSCTELGSS